MSMKVIFRLDEFLMAFNILFSLLGFYFIILSFVGSSIYLRVTRLDEFNSGCCEKIPLTKLSFSSYNFTKQSRHVWSILDLNLKHLDDIYIFIYMLR